MNDADKMREDFEAWCKNEFKQLYVFNEDGSGYKDTTQCKDWEAWQAATEQQNEVIAELVEKAQAVIDRWESPDWHDGTHTGDYIYALRDVVKKVRIKNE